MRAQLYERNTRAARNFGRATDGYTEVIIIAMPSLSVASSSAVSIPQLSLRFDAQTMPRRPTWLRVASFTFKTSTGASYQTRQAGDVVVTLVASLWNELALLKGCRVHVCGAKGHCKMNAITGCPPPSRWSWEALCSSSCLFQH